MGYSSQAGAVIFRQQAVQGTYQADTGTAGINMPLRSGSLGANRDLLITDPEIGGGRDVIDAYLGAVSWGGDYEFYVRPDGLPTLLKAILGSAGSAVATGVNTHTVTPSNAAQLPYLSIEEKIGANLETYQYTDGVANTFHLESEANGYMMGTVGIIAAKQIAGAAPTATPDVDASPLIVGTNINVTYNSITMPAKSFSLDINNNFEDDDFRLGSFYLGDLTPKRREVTAGFAIRESSSALWRQSVYGSSAATQPGGLVAKAPLVIECNAYEDIPGSSPLTKYSVDITIPNFALTPYTLEMSGDDIIESDIEGQALKMSSANIITVVVTNNRADIV